MPVTRNFQVLLDTGERSTVRGRVGDDGRFGVWRLEGHPPYICRSTQQRMDTLVLTYLPTGERVAGIEACVDPRHRLSDAMLEAAGPFGDNLEWLAAVFVPQFLADLESFHRLTGITPGYGGTSRETRRDARLGGESDAEAVAEWIRAYRPRLQLRLW